MKKLKQGLLLAVLLLLGAYVTIPLIKQQIGIWHSGKISDLFNSFGYNYLYDRSILTDEGSVRIGLIRVDDGYCLVTVSLPSLWEEAVAQYTPVYAADTDDETVRAWYGICGTEAEPQLLLLLDEDNPRCRDVDLVGNRTAGQMDTKGTVQKILTDLSGLPDDGNQIEVTLYTAEVQEVEVKNGFSFNNAIERTGQEVYAAAQKIKETREPYLSFTIDLNEALEQMDW
mgnify:CR=1 FL=1